MDVAINFSQSAFKHGFSKVDICNAVINVLYDDILDEATDKHLLIGFDGNGKLLEILYNMLDDNTVRVFHAMKCRNAFKRLLEKE